MSQPPVDPPTGDSGADHAAANPADPELADPELADPELADPELADPELADPALADLLAADRQADLAELVEAELSEMWPDSTAGTPQGAERWFDELSADERDELFAAGCDPEPSDADADVMLEALGPGPGLAGLSQDVFDAGLGRLSDDELVGLLSAARRLASWQAAMELYAVAELDARRRREAERPGWSRITEQTSSELAVALTLTGRSADELLGLSRELARLPMVLAALFDGRIDRARATVFASELSCLPDVQAAAIAAAFWAHAGSMTTGQLRAALRSMVLAIDPAAARKRAEKGRADARVEAWEERSGNGGLAGRELPPDEVIAADRRIAAIARALKQAGAPGTMDQLRAAVFTALLTGRDPESLLPSDAAQPSDASEFGPFAARPANRDRASGLAGLTGSVNLTVPLAACLGQSDSPGEVAGLGPLDAGTCRGLAARLAAEAGTQWHVILTDPVGRAVAHARARSGPHRSLPGPSPPCSRPPSLGLDPRLAGWWASLWFEWLERGRCTHIRRTPAYRPPPGLRNLIQVRHRTCAFPGCRRPARACDTDHTIPYESGGMTCECNLAPLCRRHHQTKQAPGWQVAQPEPGVLVWTAPHGRSYVVKPSAYPS